MISKAAGVPRPAYGGDVTNKMRANTGNIMGRTLLAGLLAILLAGAFALPEPVQAQGSDEIQEMQDDLRRMFARGEYEQLIESADDLLAIDPGNRAATFYRSRAETRIARGDLEPPAAGADLLRTRPSTAGREEAREATERLIEPPPPLEPRRPATGTTMLGNLLADYREHIMVGAGILLALLILLFVWLWRRSRSEPAPAAAGGGGVPLSDMPTQVQRPTERKQPAVRRSTREVRKPKKEVAPPKEAEEPREETEEKEPTPPPPPTEPTAKKEQKKKEEELPQAPPPSDSLVLEDYLQKDEEKKDKEDEIGSSLGIDYSETEQLKPEGLKHESIGGDKEEDEEKTYHSLMFGAEGDKDEEKKPEPDKDKEELSKSQFDDQFANMMFGSGAEETVQSSPGEQEPGETKAVSEDEDDPDKTRLTSPPPSAEKGSQKVSMFDRQRQTGQEALESGDYGRAVQCLSVAASLRPGDQDVRKMLEEARKKRRGG